MSLSDVSHGSFYSTVSYIPPIRSKRRVPAGHVSAELMEENAGHLGAFVLIFQDHLCLEVLEKLYVPTSGRSTMGWSTIRQPLVSCPFHSASNARLGSIFNF